MQTQYDWPAERSIFDLVSRKNNNHKEAHGDGGNSYWSTVFTLKISREETEKKTGTHRPLQCNSTLNICYLVHHCQFSIHPKFTWFLKFTTEDYYEATPTARHHHANGWFELDRVGVIARANESSKCTYINSNFQGNYMLDVNEFLKNSPTMISYTITTNGLLSTIENVNES